MIVTEQLLNTLPKDIQSWVWERNSMTSGEAGRLADDYLQACKPSQRLAGNSLVRVEKALMAERKCHNCREGVISSGIVQS